MSPIRATASSVIDAPPATVYGILADYRNGHPHILPKPYFLDLDVEQGGTGAGTVIRFRMRLFGQTRTARAKITEPVPGRVLVETEQERGIVSTFTVDPLDGGRRAAVTITSEWTSPGVQGWVERLLAPPALQRVYAEELKLLARRATSAKHPA